MQKAITTGYAYDMRRASIMLQHIEELTGISMLDYSYTEPTTEKLLVNVSSPDWVFVAIGFRARAGNVGFPVLARNIVTGRWVWSRYLIWGGDGFAWDGGNYTDEQSARDNFESECDGVLYRAEVSN